MTLVSLAACTLFTACEDKEFEPGPYVSGAQVYFSAETPTLYQLDDDETSVVIPVRRLDTTDALDIEILNDNESALLTVPSSVHFAAGSDTADLTIAIQRSSLVDGEQYPLSLLINDEANTTPYGDSRIDLVITPFPWKLYGDTEDKSRGKLRDDFFSSLFEVNSYAEVDVTVYESKSQPGVYMLENPWGPEMMGELFGESAEDIRAEGICRDANVIVDCSDPGNVTIAQQDIGVNVNDDYGWIQIVSNENEVGGGTLENGVITFPPKGLLMIMPAEGKAYYTNADGMFRILLPGAEAVDYSLAVAYGGMKVSPDGETAAAILDFTYGEDVTGIRYVLAQGAADAETLAGQIAAGTASDINDLEGFVEGAGSASAEFGLEASGAYTLVAVPLDKDGSPRAGDAASCNFFFPGLSGSTAPECDVEVELMNVSDFNPTLVTQYPEETHLAVVITGTELLEVTYYINTTELVGSIEDGSAGLTWDDIMSEYGAHLDADDVAAIEEEGYWGGVFSNRKPGTSYTIGVLAKNVYGKSKLVTSTCSTKSKSYDDYKGDLVIGSYFMTCTPGSDPFENTFTLTPDGDSTTDFIVTDLGLDDSGSSWHAAYDPHTLKLTISGIEVGYEDEGNVFGNIYGYWDSAHKIVYGYFSGEVSDEYAAPCVFSVDPGTKQITKLDTRFIVPVFSYSSEGVGDQLGSAGYFLPNTPVQLVSSSMPSAAKASVQSVHPAGSRTAAPARVRAPRIAANIGDALQFSSVSRMIAKPAGLANPLPNAGTAARCEKRATAAGIRTLDVHARVCEPLPKQIGSRKVKRGIEALPFGAE